MEASVRSPFHLLSLPTANAALRQKQNNSFRASTIRREPLSAVGLRGGAGTVAASLMRPSASNALLGAFLDRAGREVEEGNGGVNSRGLAAL